MADIITTLHPENDENTNLYPNIIKENIPDGSVDESKLSNEVNNLLSNIGELHPSGVDTSANILAKTADAGIWVGSDTGKWYYWDGSQYVEGGTYISNMNDVTYHNGNQLLDNNSNNLYPNIVTYKIKGEMPYLNFTLGILNTNGDISSSNQYIVSNKFKLSFDATLICDLGYKIRMYDYTSSSYLESSVINLISGNEYIICLSQWSASNITDIPNYLSHFELIKNSDINQSKENSILKLGYYSLATNVLRYGNITGTNGNWQNSIGTDSNGKTTLKIQFSNPNIRFISGYRNTNTRLRVYKYNLDGTYIERSYQLDGIKEYYFTLSTSNLYVFDFYYTDGTTNNDSDKFYLLYDDEKLKPRLDSNVISLLHQGGVIEGYIQNTIPNFIQCAKLGHKWIETDMSMTSDGVIVISHDDVRTDVNNVQVTISQTTYADLMTHQFYSDASLKIPTLQETLNIAKKYGINLALEYKNGFDTYFKFLDAYNFIKNNGYLDHCILETWSLGYFDSMVTNGYTDVMYLCAVNSLPDLDNLDEKWINVAQNSKGIYMALNRTLIGDANITDTVLAKIRSYGIKINVFQCDTLSLVNTYSNKVDSITSNYYSVEDYINYEV